MKLIFLDIDGVLNYDGYSRFTSTGAMFVDPVLIKRLKKIIDFTGARVVLSSTWRSGIFDIRDGKNNTTDARDAAELIAELHKYGVEIYSATPLCGPAMRGSEIKMFLDGWRGENIENFVILDDIPVMYPYSGRFVHTDYREGLTEADVDRAIEILGALPAQTSGTTVIVEEGIEDIPDECFFEDNTVEKVFLPKSLKRIGKRAFCNCVNLREVRFPQTIAYLGKEIFKGCSSLQSIALPDGIVAFGTELFADCASLKNVKLPSGLKYIPYGTFYNCVSLENVALPESVELIGKNAFHGCSALEELVLPPKIDRLDELTFYGCNSLKRIYVGGNLKNLKKSAFMNCSSLTEIIVY